MMEKQLKQSLFFMMGSIFYDARQYLDEQFKRYDLTRPEWLTLAILRVYQGQISQAVAKSHIGVENSYFTKLLNRLEERKFIIREIDQDDRRNRIIKINPKAPKELKKIFKTIYELTESIQNDLTQEQVKNLYSALKNISQNLNKYKQSRGK